MDFQSNYNIFEAVFESSADAIFVTDAGGTILSINPAFTTLTGYSKEDIIGQNPRKLKSGIHDLKYYKKLYGTISKGNTWENEVYNLKKNGTLYIAYQIIHPMKDNNGNITHYVAIHHDITEQKDLEHSIDDQKYFLNEMIDALPNPIYYRDTTGKLMNCNKAFENFLSKEKHEILGKVFNELIDNKRICDELDSMSSLTNAIEFYYKEKNILINETIFNDSNGKTLGSIGVIFDMTNIKKAEEEIKRMAFHDNLTGLPNRAMFIQRIESLINKRRKQDLAAIIMLDLDHFKDVNDILGHNTGDELLIEVGRRIVNCVRDEDLVARLGGDEFAIILHRLQSIDNAASVAEKIIIEIKKPFTINGHEIFINCSIGITNYPQENIDSSSLIRQADMALYKSKGDGRGRYQFFSGDMNERVIRRKRIENDLRVAIDKNEIMAYFQPRIDISTNKLIGMEALARWKHLTDGFIPPDEFIKIAETSGQITSIFNFMLEQSLSCVKDWQTKYDENLFVSVNLSVVQFNNKNLISDIDSMLKKYNFDPTKLQFEITETVLVESKDNFSIIESISKLGCQISIDDFGTGYSSLVYLKKFDTDSLKIDKSFTADLDNNESRAITTAIIGLSKNLNLSVVAEGVETEDQLSILSGLGCGEGQGYYFAKPMPKHEFEQFIISWNEKT